jgi:hypothetical protein
MIEYTHTKLEEEVRCIAGYYAPVKEGRIKYKNREVLYVLGSATIEASCCGVGKWCYVNIPGYVIHWQNNTNKAGLPVSIVEPVTDKTERSEIEKILRETEPAAASLPEINFW